MVREKCEVEKRQTDGVGKTQAVTLELRLEGGVTLPCRAPSPPCTGEHSRHKVHGEACGVKATAAGQGSPRGFLKKLW